MAWTDILQKESIQKLVKKITIKHNMSLIPFPLLSRFVSGRGGRADDFDHVRS